MTPQVLRFYFTKKVSLYWSILYLKCLTEGLIYIIGFSLHNKIRLTGVVTSPNYPENYPEGFKRTYKIRAEQGMVVELDFTAFNTEPNRDTLTILDNDGTVLSQERSGDCLPPKMWSRTNVVHLRFVTSWLVVTRTGWSANWTSVAPTGCTLKTKMIKKTKLNLPNRY